MCDLWNVPWYDLFNMSEKYIFESWWNSFQIKGCFEEEGINLGRKTWQPGRTGEIYQHREVFRATVSVDGPVEMK